MVEVTWLGIEECRQKSSFETTLMLGLTCATRTLSEALDNQFLAQQVESGPSARAVRLTRTPPQLFLSWKRTQVSGICMVWLCVRPRASGICKPCPLAMHHG